MTEQQIVELKNKFVELNELEEKARKCEEELDDLIYKCDHKGPDGQSRVLEQIPFMCNICGLSYLKVEEDD